MTIDATLAASMPEPGLAQRAAAADEAQRADPERTVAIVTRGPVSSSRRRAIVDNERTIALADDGTHVAAAPLIGGNLLPPGTRLGEFEISGLVGEGGFGIVYRADDHSLGRVVALKEYMPAALAARTADYSVSVKSERVRETFEIGLRSFINEARMLAQFDHPALVKVYRFWEANGTAYMAMPYYDGVTLKHVLQSRAEPPDETWLRHLVRPLLDALDLLHRGNCLHRDISPDNIMIVDGDAPVLLDFGAARRVIGDATQALTVILKPGYAPIEQYDAIPGMKQGPWTDLYALAAVVHFAITGRPPAPSVGRVVQDTHMPLVQSAAGKYSEAFLAAIDWALAPQPQDRPQSAAEWRQALDRDAAPPAAMPSSVVAAPVAPEPPGQRLVTAGGREDGARLASTAVREFPPSATPPQPLAETTAAVPRGPSETWRGARRGGRWFAMTIGAGVVAAIAAAWLAGGLAHVVPGGRTSAARSAPAVDAAESTPQAPAAAPMQAPTASPGGPTGPGGREAATAAAPPRIDAAAAPTDREVEPSKATPPRPAPVAAGLSPAPAPRVPPAMRAPALPAGSPQPADESAAGTAADDFRVDRPVLREALREARVCFAQRRYECTIARARAVLDAEPGNVVAQRLMERARKGQEDALNGDWKMR